MNSLECPCLAAKVVERKYDLTTKFTARLCDMCRTNDAFDGFVSEETLS